MGEDCDGAEVGDKWAAAAENGTGACVSEAFSLMRSTGNLDTRECDCSQLVGTDIPRMASARAELRTLRIR